MLTQNVVISTDIFLEAYEMSPRKKIGHRAGKSDHKTYCCVVYGVTKDITRKLLCAFFFFVKGLFALFHTIYSSDIPLLFEYTILSIWKNCMKQKSICPHWIWSDLIFPFYCGFLFFYIECSTEWYLKSKSEFYCVLTFLLQFFFRWFAAGIDFAQMVRASTDGL